MISDKRPKHNGVLFMQWNDLLTLTVQNSKLQEVEGEENTENEDYHLETKYTSKMIQFGKERVRSTMFKLFYALAKDRQMFHDQLTQVKWVEKKKCSKYPEFHKAMLDGLHDRLCPQCLVV